MLAAVLFAGIALALLIVLRAQREIDRRTEALDHAREALARFVSRQVRRSADGDGGDRMIGARRSETTVLFMDIRDFSSFADAVPPEEAAELVRQIAEIGFAAVLAHGGDVDRLVGDGLVARFDGPARVGNAFAAAERILREVAAAGTPRSVGIGIADGVVVEATIVAGERADATILGRTVNLCARLCSAARPGEIVAPATLAASAALAAAGTDRLTLKGHRDLLTVRRHALAKAG